MNKVSKQSVHYRPARLAAVRCATCIMFHPDGSCGLVAGTILPADVCDRWEPRTQAPSGQARENLAAIVGLAAAGIFAAAEVAVLEAIAHWVGMVVASGLLSNLGARRLRVAVTQIFAQAQATARPLLAELAADVRADAERVVRRDLATIGGLAGGAPPGPTSPERLRPPVIPPSVLDRAISEAFTGPASAEWRSIPSLLHTAELTAWRSADDIYRQVIQRAITVKGLSRRDRAQEALDEFAAKGITGFTDSLGRQWDLATYVEMATRTAASRLHLALQLAGMGPAGFDLVIVVHSSSEPACPKCVPYIGRVLSLSGMTPTGESVTITDAAGVARTAEVVASLAEAKAHGLFHPNCRCSLTPFTDGAGYLPLQLPPPGVGKWYEAEQALRRHERAVRRERRTLAAAITPQARRRARAAVARATVRLEDHVTRTGVTRHRSREHINRAR